MKREQIIEIIKNNIKNIYVEDQLSGSDPPYLTHKYHNEWVGFDKAADAILALPLEVPSGEEIIHESCNRFVSNTGYFNAAKSVPFRKGANWAINEIIKRNTINP